MLAPLIFYNIMLILNRPNDLIGNSPTTDANINVCMRRAHAKTIEFCIV